MFFNLNSVLYEAAVHSGGHGDTEAIIKHIEDTIERLVKSVNPKSLIFLALDGVLPKAKMMRHRSNKFRVAENMKLASAAAARRGEVLKTFDLNALTAGTEFMVELMRRLKSFVQRKISQDNSWAPKVILSGSDVPGEGDHKILDYLRNCKNSVEWMPNQRHCFYGLDASTVMSVLVIHEPHCYLFKEKSTRSKGSKGPAARVMLENNTKEEFLTCSIGLLREYLGMEMESRLPWSFRFDIERVIDDFVLFCIIAGNDFLPAVECFDGSEALMENLMESYKHTLPFLGGYITQMGRINGERLQKVLDHCSAAEEARVHQQLRAISDGVLMEAGSKIDQDFLFISNRAARDILNEAHSPDHAIHAWKERHYQEKLQIPPDEKQAVVKQYFEGLSWAMRCFYRGIPSWNWFFTHHYAPMISDMKDMDPAKVLFRMGNPVTPLCHLMSVIPRASHKLVPRILQPLITDPKSPLTSFYPNDCRVDMEGKRMDWEAVVLLPFLDDKRLAHILSRVPPSRLSPEELERTKTGHALIFTSTHGLIRVHFCVCDPSCSGNSSGDNSTLRRTIDGSDSCSLSALKVFRSELTPGTCTGTSAPPGFWSLHSLKVVPSLKRLHVCLFNYPSDRFTVQLSLPSVGSPSRPEALIGRIVYVDWPSLHRARIVRVDECPSANSAYDPSPRLLSVKGQFPQRPLSVAEWTSKVEEISHRNFQKKGIDIGRVQVLVTVKKIIGSLRHGLDHLVERHGPEEVFPLQAVFLDNVYPGHVTDLAEEQKIDLCPHDRLLYVGGKYPGTIATVLEGEDPLVSDGSTTHTPTGCLDVPDSIKNTNSQNMDDDESLLVSLQVYSPASFSSVRNVQRLLRSTMENYHPSGNVATRLGITPQGLSRITGSLWVNTGNERQEIGLAVKLGSKNMCVAGYVRPSPNGTGWEYTDSLINILENYRNASCWVFEAVDATPEGGEINLKHVFPRLSDADLNGMVRRAKEWLNGLPLTGRPLVTAEACVGSIAAIQQAQTMLSISPGVQKPVMTRVPRSQLIPPSDKSSVRSKETGGEMCIGDFVVYIGSSLISFGSPGVVIGTLSGKAEVLFSSKVLQPVSMFGDSTKQCSCLVSNLDLVNISHLTGEDRPKITHPTNKIMTIHRTKSSSSNRPHGQFPHNNMRRKGRPSWNECERRVVHGSLSPHRFSIHDTGCSIQPIMPISPYGSGVYIAGLTPLPGLHGSVPQHPMPFLNYSLTPRY